MDQRIHPFVAGTIGGLIASVLWLVVLIGVVALLREVRSLPAVSRGETAPELEARLVREAKSVLGGRMGEWNAASVEGQQAACLIAVRATHPNDDAQRQRMLARLIWAQVAYVMEDNPLPNSTVSEAIALIDTLDYQSPTKKRPLPELPPAIWREPRSISPP